MGQKEKALLNDLEGIRAEGSGSLHILAAGGVKIEGKAVFLTGSLYVAEQAVSDVLSGRLGNMA